MQTIEQHTTPETLSAESIARYRSQGFVHVEQVLTQEEVAEFRSHAMELLDQSEKMSWDMEDGNTAMDWVADANRKSGVMKRLAEHPGITGIAERLTGGSLLLFKSELLRKKVQNLMSGTPAHDDRSVFPFNSEPAALTAWVPLVDVPAERGCMSYIHGSHTRSEPTDWDDEANLYPLTFWPELVWQPRTVVPARAGDVVFHHERTVHMAGANETDTARAALSTIYMSADSLYRHNPFYAYMYTEDPDLGGMQPEQPLREKVERFPRVGPGQ